jgi:hypothetical protein
MIEGNVTARIIQSGTVSTANKALIAFLETPNGTTLTYDNSKEFEMKKFNFTRNETYLNYNLTTNRGLSVIGINPKPDAPVTFEILL